MKRKIMEKLSPVSTSIYKPLFQMEEMLKHTNKNESFITKLRRSLGLV